MASNKIVHDLIRRIHRAEAELKVRTFCPGFPSVPDEEYRVRGRWQAFDAGYANGWRGGSISDNPYSRTDCIMAWAAGWRQGSMEVAHEIARVLGEVT